MERCKKHYGKEGFILSFQGFRSKLGRFEPWKRGELESNDLKCELEKKYLVKKKGISAVLEELKQ